jgi:DNA-binding NtrC family response regulator
MNKPELLIVDDDRIILDSLCEFLRLEGYATSPAQSADQAIAAMERQPYTLVITDVNMPDRDGIALLTQIKSRFPQTGVIVLTGYGTIGNAVEAIKLGAFDYLTKPVVDDDLRLAVERAIRQQTIIRENRSFRSQREQKCRLENILSRDNQMAKIFELIEAVADSKTTILMTGKSGTGKSLQRGRSICGRTGGTSPCGGLVRVAGNAAGVGTVRACAGSFTGAVRDKQGKFLAADGGTIFLMRLRPRRRNAGQVAVLQERQFEPVGNKTITVDTRVLLASNTDLAEEVRAGDFARTCTTGSMWLWWRFHGWRKGRRHPIAGGAFSSGFCRTHERTKDGISAEAMELLGAVRLAGQCPRVENDGAGGTSGKGNRIETEDLRRRLEKPEACKLEGIPGWDCAGPAEPEKAIRGRH